MYPTNTAKSYKIMDKMNVYAISAQPVEVQADLEITRLLGLLSPENPWGDRKNAALKLGHIHSPKALSGLLDALLEDPFWMVRCAVIQALEMIGDPSVTATLRSVALNDRFQVVRSHAAKAVERLS